MMRKVKLCWIFQVLCFCPSLIYYYFLHSNAGMIKINMENSSIGRIPPIISEVEVKLNDTVLLYNRVPKSGSTTLISLLEALHGKIQIHVGIMSRKYWLRDNQDPKMICDHLTHTLQYARQFGKPTIAIGHVAYVDAENDCKIANSRIIYMNQVRHPVSAFISNYYYSKEMYLTQNRTDEFFQPLKNVEDYDIPPTSRMHYYMRFCGYGDICWNPSNDPGQLISYAKTNIETNYLVVGILEEFDLSMKVYETIMPQYFLGISQLYRLIPTNRSRLNAVSYKPPSQEEWEILSSKMRVDIEFYDYLKQRLHFQARAFNLQ